MSKAGREPASQPESDQSGSDQSGEDPQDAPTPGPNLALLYSLIGLALALAIGLAVMIVLPFYHRR